MRGVRAILGACLCLVAGAFPIASAQAAAWLPPFDLASGTVAFSSAEMTRQGDVIALWRSFEGGPYKIYGSVRPAGGSFGTGASLSPVESVVESIDVVADATGNAVSTWRQGLGGEKVALFSSFRPAGGELSPAVQVLGAGDHVFQPDTDMTPSGDAMTVYRRAPGSDDHIAYLFRPAGGDFEAQQEITSYKAESPTVGLADDGTAIAAWRTGTKVEAARRPPGGSFGAIQPVSESGASGSGLSVAPGGRGLLAWRRIDGGHEIVEAAVAEPGGEFGAPVPLSSPGVDSVRFASAIGPDGSALVTWRDGGDGQLHIAVAPPGGGFESAPAPPTDMSPAEVEFSADGGLALVLSTGGSPSSVAAAIRDPAGQFGPITPLSVPGENAFSRSLSGDGAGNFVELFSVDGGGGSSTVKVAGYDGVAPRFDSLAVPARTRTGRRTAFSADSFDVWGPVTTTWAFGDGGSATGDLVTHTYRRTGGKRQVTATAADAAGNSTAARRTIEVKDATRVVISAARFQPRRFAVGRRSTALTARLTRGSTLRFKLSERAGVAVSFERGVRGRRKGRRCVPPGVAPGGRACTRFVGVRRVRLLRRNGRAGANKVRFSGRLRGRPLRPGRYRAVLRATDTGGLRAKPRRAPFRIVAR